MFTFGNRFVLAILAISVMAFTSPVRGQDSDGEAALEDFIHYALIANVEFANGNALALIRDRMTDVEFYEMVISTRERHERFDRAIGWAMFVVDLEPLATKLEERFGLSDLTCKLNPKLETAKSLSQNLPKPTTSSPERKVMTLVS